METYKDSANQPTYLYRLKRFFSASRATWLPTLGLLVVVFLLYATGIIPGLDRSLTDLRFSFTQRHASGEVVIVQIDAHSLQSLGNWPWSRSVHAKVIQNLNTAGANRIGVDIDFSSTSVSAADEALLDAIKAANGKVVLPVFKQWSSARGGEIAHTKPQSSFAKHARIGSVNLRPAPDGLVRQYERLHTWKDTFVPAFAAETIGRSTSGTQPFFLDFGISPETIPRISIVDVLRGNFDAARVKGKYVIIGATALELGDEIAVPVYGALSGPEVQALAAESIILGRTIERVEVPLSLFLALGLLLLFGRWFTRARHMVGSLAFLSVSMVLIVGTGFLQSYIPLDIPIGVSLVTIGYSYIHGLMRQLDTQALVMFKKTSEAQERRALLQAVADNNFTGIIISDESDRVRLVNNTAADWLGLDTDEITEKNLSDVMVTTDDLPAMDSHHGQNIFETTLQISGGNMIPVEMAHSEVVIKTTPGPFERRTHDRRFQIYMIRDISEHRLAEQTLIEAAQQAVEANQMKTEFIGNISHELRTPLNAIIGFSDVFKQEMFGPIESEKYRGYAEDINASGKHLLAIINDLLEVSTLAAGKVNVEITDVDINKAIDDCLRIASGYPGIQRLTVSADISPNVRYVWTDERLLKQIILNLLSNSIKFTPAGGKIEIVTTRDDTGGIKISVEDNGIGIAPDEIDNIFQPFHQLENVMQRKHHGTGLGLHIVQSQASLIGGEIDIVSTPGHGTRISIRFPQERSGHDGKIVKLNKSVEND